MIINKDFYNTLEKEIKKYNSNDLMIRDRRRVLEKADIERQERELESYNILSEFGAIK